MTKVDISLILYSNILMLFYFAAHKLVYEKWKIKHDGAWDILQLWRLHINAPNANIDAKKKKDHFIIISPFKHTLTEVF